MEFAIAGVFIALMASTQLLHILSLPANWLLLGLLGLWALGHPATDALGPNFFFITIGGAIFGEVAEFVIQTVGAKRYGSSTKGNIGGIIGAILGAIFGAPFFFGLGALFGALGGAWLGCFVVERIQGRSTDEAIFAAKGAMLGRFLGLSLKTGIGIAIVIYATRFIWP